MPKGYIIAHITVTDPDGYPEYVAKDTPILKRLGAEFLIRGGQGETVEGATGERHVMMGFPSYDAALAAYNDPEYQNVAEIRRRCAESHIVVVEGNEDAMPQGDGPYGYLIGHVTVHDLENYKPYVAGNTPVMRSHGARYIVRGGRSEVVEGTLGERHVVVAYPSYADARAAYFDPAYQALIPIRQAHSDGTMILVEGFDQ